VARPIPAALAVALLLALPSTESRAQAAPVPVVAGADSGSATARPPVHPAIAEAQAAYENAWRQRDSGAFQLAAATADSGLSHLEAALAADPDASVRRELVGLQARLRSVHENADRDARTATAAHDQGNEPDDSVLNTPAAEELAPQYNEDVYRWIDFFTGAGRSVFERWLKRSGRYMALFRNVLQREGLPPDLVHLVFVESGFNVNARSIARAVGPWQFLGGTAKLFGLTVDRWVDERKDPEKSTVAAARYLKHLYSIFGDWPLALASYNAGEGTVLRAIKAQGTTNYWDLRLPRQTEEYVPQFMAVMAIARDPQKYGFDAVELDEPMEFDEVALKGAVDLRALARMAGCPYEELRALNPAVLSHAARGRDGVTVLRVPPGKGEALLQQLRDGSALPAVDLTLSHKVRRNETLAGIARQYGVSARQLALANGIGRKRPLRRGMTLTVPASLHSPAPQILESDDPRASTAYVPPRSLRPITSLGAQSSAEGRTTITVQRGETLASIAARYGVSVEDIRRWNRLTTTTVHRGTRLKIRTGEAISAVPTAADSAAIAAIKVRPARPHHRGARSASSRGHAGVTVRSGQTLGEIARQHGVSVSALKRANGLRSDRVRAGQRLRLPG
jgi:membrane-bound lytic murein transglycosylase D